MASIVALLKNIDAALDLISDGRPRQPPVGAKAAIVAVYTAANRNGPIDVRARKSCVYRYSVDFGSKPFFQEAAEGVVALLAGEMGRHGHVQAPVELLEH